MKNYDKNIYEKKFLSYKRAFLFFAVTLTLSVILGTVLEKTGLLTPFLDRITPPFIRGEREALQNLLLFTVLFLSGATIFAPTTAVITLMLFGVSSAERLSGLSLYPFVLEFISSVFTAYLLTSYAAFTTLTALRIFTDEEVAGKALFTGTLFRAQGFRGIFNLKYIGSYILFFIIFTSPSLCAAIIKEYLLF